MRKFNHTLLRLVAFSLAVLLILSCAACGKKKDKAEETGKDEITEELEALKEKKSSLSTNKEEKIIVIKKSVPILEKCIEKYPSLSPEGKNKLLKAILSKVYYKKGSKGTEFNITPEFKI